LLSPVTDSTLSGSTLKTHQRKDPMIRRGWLQQGLGWYASKDASVHQPLEQNLRGLPPMLIQVGDQEVLRSDSTRLAQHATECGVDCKLEIYAGRWHVFQLQSFYLSSAKQALHRLADFARACVKARSEEHVALPSLDLSEIQTNTP
jgi:acetyl esterase/lipase